MVLLIHGQNGQSIFPKRGAEIIQLQMDTIPPTNIFGVYLETKKSAEEKEYAHKKTSTKSYRM